MSPEYPNKGIYRRTVGWSRTKDGPRFLIVPGAVGTSGLRETLNRYVASGEVTHEPAGLTASLIDLVQTDTEDLFLQGGLITSNGDTLITPFESLELPDRLAQTVNHELYLSQRISQIHKAYPEFDTSSFAQDPQQGVLLVIPGINSFLTKFTTRGDALTFSLSLPGGEAREFAPLRASLERYFKARLRMMQQSYDQRYVINPVFKVPTILEQTLVDLLPDQKS